MKVLVVFAAVAVVYIGAIPVFEEQLGELPYEIYEDDQTAGDQIRHTRSAFETYHEEEPLEDTEELTQGLRLKRATCDALSFQSKWITINHSACAIHCIAKGYKGGQCKNTVCHCRK
uniref:Defensin 2 n=1 Tax=Coridius chinensis TaxID=1028097 RepID=A0A7S8BGW0_CORCQ|nr:defensin 2 [Coridius chinensis]